MSRYFLIIAVVILTFISFNASSQSINKVTRIKDGLQGNVRKVKLVEYSFGPDSLGITRIDTTYIQVKDYDITGQLVHSEATLSRNHFPSVTTNLSSTYKFDKAGNLVAYAGCMAFDGTVKFRYDNNNNLIEETRYTQEGILFSRERFKYVQGILVRSVEEHMALKAPTRMTRYDYRGNIIENTWTLKDDTRNIILTGKQDFTYNSRNELVEEIKYNYPTNISRRTTHRYDEHGNDIEEIRYISEKLVSKIKCKYDGKKNLLQSRKYDNESILLAKHTYTYLYSADNNLMEKKETNINPYHTTYITEKYADWDSHGNYLDKTTTIIDEDKKQMSAISREIEYYK